MADNQATLLVDSKQQSDTIGWRQTTHPSAHFLLLARVAVLKHSILLHLSLELILSFVNLFVQDQTHVGNFVLYKRRTTLV